MAKLLRFHCILPLLGTNLVSNHSRYNASYFLSTQSFLKTIAAVSTLGFVILLDVTTIIRINFLLY